MASRCMALARRLTRREGHLMSDAIGIFFTNATGAIFRIELDEADANDLIARFPANYSLVAPAKTAFVDLTYRDPPLGFELIK